MNNVDLIFSGILNETYACGRLHDEIARLLRDSTETRAHGHDLLGTKTKGMELLAHSLGQTVTPMSSYLLNVKSRPYDPFLLGALLKPR